MNPYYDSSSLGLDIISFEKTDLCYAFNMLCFWATKEGRIYSASDSGCSCPTPFENYAFNTLDEVLQTLEAVGSVEQAERIFDSWNENRLPISEKQYLSNWLKYSLKQ